MLTVHPSIILGSYLWDEERLPRDEFEIRMRPIRMTMGSRDWAATLIYGDAREHAALAYLSNFIPRMRWAMALLPAEGEPRLLASMSSRDIPAMRTMTWIDDVKSGWEWRWFDDWVKALPGSGTIGTIGLSAMTPLLFSAVEKSLASRYTLAEGDDALHTARIIHRPREILVMREAAGIAAEAAAALRAAWQAGADMERAALAAERQARDRAAQDVRTLVSRDGGRTLEPFAASFDDRPAHLSAYVAVKYLGYWGEAHVHSGAPAILADPARTALDAIIAQMTAGMPLESVAAKGAAALGGRTMHPALASSFGHRIGLSIVEGDVIRTGATGVVKPNTVYALRAGITDAAAGGCIASAMVLTFHAGPPEILLRTDGK